MTDVKLKASPRLRVVLADGTELEVQSANPDWIRWDLERARQKWPSFQEAVFLWQTFMAWAALRREGRIETKWSDFSTSVLEVESLDDETADDGEDDETGPDADPTSPGPEPG